MDEDLNGVQLRSTVTAEGQLRLSLEPVSLGEIGPDEVIVRVEATPINPSDLGLLLGPADLSTMRSEEEGGRPILVADVPPRALAAVQGRVGRPMAVGNEGAGTVVRAGANATGLIGRKVGAVGGGMYAQFRKLPAAGCIPLPDGASAADGAAMFVNPMTALSFLETMKAEGHKAIVHSAAASNLGVMLNRLCLADGVPLVNIVRSDAQVEHLRGLGARFIVNSTAADFRSQLIDAVAATGATLGFDAVGGGKLAGQMLGAMEAAASRAGGSYSIYGSGTPKQVYIYGALDPGPTVLDRNFGLTWNLGGWLLSSFLQKAGPDVGARLRKRVADELLTTFASRYTAVIGLADMLRPDVVRAYQRKATGEKYLIDPRL